MHEATIAAGFAKALMDLAVSKGADRAALAERSGIDPAVLQDQDNRVPFVKFMALMRTAKVLCNEPALALHFGEATDCSELSIVGLLGRSCETVADAFAQVNRYARLAADFDAGESERFALKRDGAGLWIVDNRKDPNAYPEHTEGTFARMVTTSRRLSDRQFVQELHVTHPEPAYRAEYDRIFRAPVVFNSDRNAVRIDEAWMSQRIALAPRYAFGILSEHADALLKSLEASKTTRGRVEGALMPILHTGNASMEAIAAKMGISRQTLFRKLKAEGTSFEKVLDGLRHKLAVDYLGGKKVSVNETAYLVGFSDPAAFSRAFKRWTGASPRTVRAAAAEAERRSAGL